MGTTLTGTTPQDTYDSLIKVTDNGPLSGTAKYLSDGLGNDSVLALSTTAVGVGTATPLDKLQITDGRLRFLESGQRQWSVGIQSATPDFRIREETFGFTPFTITGAGNVGIGTSAPASPLSVGGTAVYDLPASTANFSTADAGKFQLRLTSSSFNVDGNWIGLGMGYSENYMKTAIIARAYDGAGRGTINFCLNTSSTSTNVSLADTRVTVTSNGLTFNGDTAAANALDDYEEGTFTPVFRGATSAGSYTFALGGGSYTKIGNQVTVWITLIDVTESSAGSGDWQIGGLPFTSRNAFDLARVGTACWIRSSAAARDNIICGVFNNSSNISFLYDANGSGAGSNFTIASDFLTNMDIGLQVTYYV